MYIRENACHENLYNCFISYYINFHLTNLENLLVEDYAIDEVALIDTTITAGFRNISFRLPDTLKFDVMVSTNVPNLEFGQGNIFLTYPNEVFDSNIVTKNNITVSKAEILEHSAYTLNIQDFDHNTIRINIQGGCTDGHIVLDSMTLLDSFQSLLTIQAKIENLFAIDSLIFDSLQVAGDLFYLNPVSKACDTFHSVVIENPVLIQDLCKCEFEHKSSNSWYIKDVLTSTNYQKDVYVFRQEDNAAYQGMIDTSIVDSIVYDSSPQFKYNIVYFDSSSTIIQRQNFIDSIRDYIKFEMEFPTITNKPNSHYSEKEWMFSNDIVKVVFHNPKPTYAEVEYIAKKYGLIIDHIPDTILPTGLNSWTHSFKIDPSDCNCLNVIDVSRNIYAQESTVKIVEPWLEPSKSYLTSNDPYYESSWHIKNDGQCLGADNFGNGTIDADCDIEEAWDFQSCLVSTIRVGVIDGGYYEDDHLDISEKYVDGYDYIDDDDDVTFHGANVTELEIAHGQCCAGLIAAVGDNEEGIIGVAPNSEIVPLISYYGNAWQAFQYACLEDVDVMSCSWGLEGGYDQSLRNEIELCSYLGRGGLGMVIVFSAGNDGLSNGNFFPANLEEVIGVIASNPDDQLKRTDDGWAPWGSNFGLVYDIAAPGTHLITTDQVNSSGNNFEENNCLYENDLDEEYTYFNGTSAATPIVAGAAAYVLACHPTYSRLDVHEVLFNSADKVGGYDYDVDNDLPGKSEEMGHGRLNLNRVITKVEETAENINFNIFPNPASKVIRVDAPMDSYTSLRILNSQGVTIIEEAKVNLDKGIEISRLTPGVYHLRLTSINRVGIRTFIVH